MITRIGGKYVQKVVEVALTKEVSENFSISPKSPN